MTATDLAGCKALVTGGASGIGAAICETLTARGADVRVADRDGYRAAQLADRIGATAWEVDLDCTYSLEEVLDHVPLETDILVNCAGMQHVAPIDEFSVDRFRAMHRVMVEAAFLLIRSALPHMYEQGWGRIINISSVHGLRASPDKAPYVAAKHALEGLSKATALEGAAYGVTSNTICPGWVDTPLAEGQHKPDRFHTIPIKSFIEPSEVAELAAFLCTDAARHITGASYTIDGGWTAR